MPWQKMRGSRSRYSYGLDTIHSPQTRNHDPTSIKDKRWLYEMNMGIKNTKAVRCCSLAYKLWNWRSWCRFLCWQWGGFGCGWFECRGQWWRQCWIIRLDCCCWYEFVTVAICFIQGRGNFSWSKVIGAGAMNVRWQRRWQVRVPTVTKCFTVGWDSDQISGVLNALVLAGFMSGI
jgi:hypothetical protein